jgi:predicted CopG family antitoxin
MSIRLDIPSSKFFSSQWQNIVEVKFALGWNGPALNFARNPKSSSMALRSLYNNTLIWAYSTWDTFPNPWSLIGASNIKIHIPFMAHKTITISEEAYRELARMKRDNESFTEVILRITSRKGSAEALLRFLELSGRSEELARNVELVVERTRKARLHKMALS